MSAGAQARGAAPLALVGGLPWIAGVAAFFVFPNYLAFGTQVLITILFALSLDLVLGYAGIVTLGHAAFFGAGAYTVGILAQHAAGTSRSPDSSRLRSLQARSAWRAAWSCCARTA
jgi:ABC-type branched-subunit amino acid transport system permease subunit